MISSPTPSVSLLPSSPKPLSIQLNVYLLRAGIVAAALAANYSYLWWTDGGELADPNSRPITASGLSLAPRAAGAILLSLYIIVTWIRTGTGARTHSLLVTCAAADQANMLIGVSAPPQMLAQLTYLAGTRAWRISRALADGALRLLAAHHDSRILRVDKVLAYHIGHKCARCLFTPLYDVGGVQVPLRSRHRAARGHAAARSARHWSAMSIHIRAF